MQGASVWCMLAPNRTLPRGNPRRSVQMFPFYRWENGALRVVVMGPRLSVLVPLRQVEMVSFLSLVMWDTHVSEASSRGLWDSIQSPVSEVLGAPLSWDNSYSGCGGGWGVWREWGQGAALSTQPWAQLEEPRAGETGRSGPAWCWHHSWGTQTWTHAWALPLQALRPSLL